MKRIVIGFSFIGTKYFKRWWQASGTVTFPYNVLLMKAKGRKPFDIGNVDIRVSNHSGASFWPILLSSVLHAVVTGSANVPSSVCPASILPINQCPGCFAPINQCPASILLRPARCPASCSLLRPARAQHPAFWSQSPASHHIFPHVLPVPYTVTTCK